MKTQKQLDLAQEIRSLRKRLHRSALPEYKDQLLERIAATRKELADACRKTKKASVPRSKSRAGQNRRIAKMERRYGIVPAKGSSLADRVAALEAAMNAPRRRRSATARLSKIEERIAKQEAEYGILPPTEEGAHLPPEEALSMAVALGLSRDRTLGIIETSTMLQLGAILDDAPATKVSRGGSKLPRAQARAMRSAMGLVTHNGVVERGCELLLGTEEVAS